MQNKAQRFGIVVFVLRFFAKSRLRVNYNKRTGSYSHVFGPAGEHKIIYKVYHRLLSFRGV